MVVGKCSGVLCFSSVIQYGDTYFVIQRSKKKKNDIVIQLSKKKKNRTSISDTTLTFA